MKKPNIKEWQNIILESLANTYNAEIEYYLNLSIVTYIDNGQIYLRVYKDSATRAIFICTCESEQERRNLIEKYKKANDKASKKTESDS